MKSHDPGTRTARRRRGSAYALVLTTALIVTVIGLSAVTIARITRRAAQGADDLTHARLHALSAIEAGTWYMANDPTWRQTFPSGVWIQDQPIGGGTMTLSGVDATDGDLTDAALDPIQMTGTGTNGVARYKLQVTLQAAAVPAGCLSSAVHAGQGIVFNAAVMQADQPVSCNGTMTASSSSVLADVEAVGTISGGNYVGSTLTGAAPRTMPDGTVFDYYVTNGTPIAYGALPTNTSGAAELTGVVLSPASNPYGGTTNTDGIYVIDCLGLNLDVKDTRIVGTLVLLNPGPVVVVKHSINWAPAVANYPAMLVDGDVAFSYDGSPLTEGPANFNPPGTPYAGQEDTDITDTYPSVIQGLVYVAGSASIGGQATLDGVFITGATITVTGTWTVNYDAAYLADPPPGFLVASTMQVVPGTWRQVVD